MSRRRLLTVPLLTSQLLAHFTSGGLVTETEEAVEFREPSTSKVYISINDILTVKQDLCNDKVFSKGFKNENSNSHKTIRTNIVQGEP